MTLSRKIKLTKLQIWEMREKLDLYREANKLENLKAYAVLDQISQKYFLKITDEVLLVSFLIRLERINDGLRLMNLGTTAKNIRDFGFTSFTVVMEGDI